MMKFITSNKINKIKHARKNVSLIKEQCLLVVYNFLLDYALTIDLRLPMKNVTFHYV